MRGFTHVGLAHRMPRASFRIFVRIRHAARAGGVPIWARNGRAPTRGGSRLRQAISAAEKEEPPDPEREDARGARVRGEETRNRRGQCEQKPCADPEPWLDADLTARVVALQIYELIEDVGR